MSDVPNASSTLGWRRIRRFLAARVDRGSEVGLRLTIAVAVFAAGSWAFGGLLEDVLERESLVRWDFAVHSWLYSRTTPGGVRAFRIVAQFGGPALYAIIMLVALMLAMQRQRLLLWFWLAVVIGGLLVEFALKATIRRHRPLVSAAHAAHENFSFPSGHAMMSIICYVTLVFIFARLTRSSRARTYVAYVAAIALSVAIGFSRLYLGVHYPSDVLGGFTVGVAWVAASVTTLYLVERRNHVNASARRSHASAPLHSTSRSER